MSREKNSRLYLSRNLLSGVYQTANKIEESKVPVVLKKYLENNKNIRTIILHLDNDIAGIKPTDRILTFTGINIDRVVDGRIIEHGGATNTFETLFENKLITGKTR